jgi:transcriptional regulator with XRE-family HTH domain
MTDVFRSLAVSPGASVAGGILAGSGLNQAELARRAGLPRSVVNAYVRGTREPGADTLARLAAAGGLELQLAPRKPPVDVDRASKILVEVLELAEALPFRPRPELRYPRLPDRVDRRGAAR